MMKAHDQNATSFQKVFFLRRPDLFRNSSSTQRGDDKKHRRNSQTESDGIVCGLSINKDFLFAARAGEGQQHWKDERCVYYTFFIGTKRGLVELPIALRLAVLLAF